MKNAWCWSILGLLVPAFLIGCAPYRRICVTPGFPVTHTYTVHNASQRTYEAVNIGVEKPSNVPITVIGRRVVETPDAPLPIDIEPGETRTFEVSFMVGRAGEPRPESNFSILFKVLSYPKSRGWSSSATRRFMARKACP